ncbi:hypothetical protein EDB81DRAFT_10892 [Dactylonectria macrodidyma]|uniref:Uncharacterized protein n=1 Tax=Dactylonectria macrodidyma TaxID=307937 RepID=A0A9P9FSC1_9HYPO|nr:hypothetical protein EDB81DRAFT_10892 [Dactylonectria macrodidyma]
MKRTEVHLFFCFCFSTFSMTHDDTIRLLRCKIFTPTAGILQSFMEIHSTPHPSHKIGRNLPQCGYLAHLPFLTQVCKPSSLFLEVIRLCSLRQSTRRPHEAARAFILKDTNPCENSKPAIAHAGLMETWPGRFG